MRILRNAISAVLGAGIAAAPVAGAAAAPGDGYDWGWRSPHMVWGIGWSGMVLGPLLMALLVAVLLAALFILVRWLTTPRHQPPMPPYGRPTPLDILKERFARGEIDKEEYEERRRVLRD